MVMNPQLRTPGTPTSVMGGQGGLTSQGHMISQPSLSSQSGIGVNNIHPTGSGAVSASLGGPGALGGSTGVSVSASSVSTTTTNTLPSFKSSMGLNVLGPVSSSFPDGSLPSITTATSSFPTALHNHNDDFLRESVINDILEVQFILHDLSHVFLCLLFSYSSCAFVHPHHSPHAQNRCEYC